jgi:hypothetical protein
MDSLPIAINIWAVLLAAVVGVFGLGGLWYSPWIFGNIWAHEAGIDPKSEKKRHPAGVFGVSVVMGLISAGAFALYLGDNPPLRVGVTARAFVGVCFVATSFAINYMFSGRSIKLLAIDASYHILQFVVYGLILGLWH